MQLLGPRREQESLTTSGRCFAIFTGSSLPENQVQAGYDSLYRVSVYTD